MLNATHIRIFTGFFLTGICLGQPTEAHSGGMSDEVFAYVLEKKPFLPITQEHRAAWNLVLEDCFPVNTRTSLSDDCIASLGQYFANEPVWYYNVMYIYTDDPDLFGWAPLYYNELSQRRNHTQADYINADVPFWRDIFDGRIKERQRQFLDVVNDSQCSEIANTEISGMQEQLADRCVVRELYKYAAYLSACFDAKNRLSALHRVYEGNQDVFERSMLLMDEMVSDESLKLKAKTSMGKSYLHATWVDSACAQYGFVTKPEVSRDPAISKNEKLTWGSDYKKYLPILHRTHDYIMKISIKSGDDWAIRSGYLGRSIISEFSEDLISRYPLLMHRTIGDYSSSYGLDFSLEELNHHQAKAYLLLVEKVGEEIAQQEYDPVQLADAIQYVKSGGALKSPLSPAQIEESYRELGRQIQQHMLRQESQSELSQ